MSKERLTINEAILHAKEIAKSKYLQGMLCHANPNDNELDKCIECGKEHEQLAEWLEELKQYRELEEQGLLLRLPIAVGSEVYLINSHYTKCTKYGEIFNEDWCQGCEDECDSHKKYYIHKNMSVSAEWIIHNIKDIGKSIFITQSEAEEKLRELEGK